MSMHRLSRVAIIAFVLLSLHACSPDDGAVLTAPQAYTEAQAGKLILIDVRHSDEWKATGVATGALLISMTSEQGEADFAQRVDEKLGHNRHARIALISLAGNRSANAQQVLRKAGFTHVNNIREGMAGNGAGPGWIARGLPVEPCEHC